MRQLFVIRHAVAYERSATRWPDDRLRPLTKPGKRRFRRTARGFADFLDRPDELLTSSLKRARQTARILCEEADYPKPEQLRELRPGKSTSALIATLDARPGKCLAIVGHEPQLGALISDLLAGPKANINSPLKKGGIAVLQFEDAIAAGKGQLLLFAPPRVFRKRAGA